MCSSACWHTRAVGIKQMRITGCGLQRPSMLFTLETWTSTPPAPKCHETPHSTVSHVELLHWNGCLREFLHHGLNCGAKQGQLHAVGPAGSRAIVTITWAEWGLHLGSGNRSRMHNKHLVHKCFIGEHVSRLGSLLAGIYIILYKYKKYLYKQLYKFICIITNTSGTRLQRCTHTAPG
jgi:hypothetical protein